jgi:hypothetical protein
VGGWSRTTTAKVKNQWSYNSAPPIWHMQYECYLNTNFFTPCSISLLISMGEIWIMANIVQNQDIMQG